MIAKRLRKRVLCVNDENNELYTVAYENPNGEIVVVILNTGWVKETAVFIDGQTFNQTLPDSSIMTLIIEK
ncbi:MAG: hypothetical protein IJR66_04230 [Clostridia bacterium]|nr:hypothetical protein [Clostridia bacterium]